MADLTGLLLVTPASRDVERDAVAAAWERAGGAVLRLDRFWDPPAVDPARVRLYGPHMFALVLQETLPIRLVSPPDDIVLSLPERFLGRRLGQDTLDATLRLPFPLFVKPLRSKVFPAGVHPAPASLAAATVGLPGETPVIWSEPVTFTAEARAFAVDRQVTAFGCYEGSGDLAAARQVARDALATLPYDGPLSLDVGLLPGHGWAVVECNEAWGSGLNGCAAESAVDVIARATTTVGAIP